MSVYLYKSKIGKAVAINKHIITVSPGLSFDNPDPLMDAQVGLLVDRYTDGVLDSASVATQRTVFTTAIKILTSTVALLPSAVTMQVGTKAMVTDATTPAFLSAVVGGGAVVTPVFSNGASWIVG